MSEERKLSLEELNKTLEKKLGEKRSEWKSKVINIIKELNSIDLDRDKHVRLHMDMLILREEIVFESANYRNKLAAIRSLHRKQKREKYQNFTTNFDIKLNSYNDKEVFIAADLTQVIRQIEIMEIYIDFLREQMFTCDKIGFSIKHLVESGQ